MLQSSLTSFAITVSARPGQVPTTRWAEWYYRAFSNENSEPRTKAADGTGPINRCSVSSQLQGDGLTAELLTALIGEYVAAPLDACKQYLEGASPDGPFRPFHKSFADFLLEDNGNARYHIDAPTMHRQIADHYWAKHHDDWSKCDTYGIESLPIHLRMAQAWTKLEKLFLDPAWLETKTERLNIYALIQDYNLTSNIPHLLKLETPCGCRRMCSY